MVNLAKGGLLQIKVTHSQKKTQKVNEVNDSKLIGMTEIAIPDLISCGGKVVRNLFEPNNAQHNRGSITIQGEELKSVKSTVHFDILCHHLDKKGDLFFFPPICLRPSLKEKKP